MLNDSDRQRFDGIMERVTERRLLRTSVPERNEEIIANITRKCEASAAEEHARLLETRSGVGNKQQQPIGKNLKKFPRLTGLKQRFG